jgi:putative acetyltransferase
MPREVGIFAALWEANDVIDELSFTALAESSDVVGHVTASRATVGSHSVVAVGPIGVLPDHQGNGIGSALMSALLEAADAESVPLVVLLGAPGYYARFGFRPAAELGVVSPEPEWGSAFQARPLSAYTPAVAGPFEYAPAFSS